MPAKILIIDDEKRVCDVVKVGLEKISDFQVSIANNGQDGIAMARKLQPDIVLLDLRMPKMDGVSVLKTLKRSNDTLGIPVVVLSAIKQDSAKLECSREFSEIYIEKPVDLMVLKEKIVGLLKLTSGKTNVTHIDHK